jgi:uncharacterized membrane protein
MIGQRGCTNSGDNNRRMSTYDIWKTAHVLSAAIILGTGIGIAFFCWFGYRGAMRSGDLGVLREVLRLTVVADACVIAAAVAFQAASGVVLLALLGWPQLSAWTVAVWSLFALAGACWIPVLFIQARLAREATRVPSVEWLPRAFHASFKRWCALGVPAFAAVIAIYWLMVAKPLSVT